MDIGAIGGWSWWGNAGMEFEQERIYTLGFKGKGKSKGRGKGECYSGSSPRHFAREPPYPQEKGKGKGKVKGFQGVCYNRGESGHPSRECPIGK